MVTDRPGVALGIITADCVPLLLADTDAGVVGAAHAGWRGAVAGVIEATIAAMSRLGARPAAIAAAIGPCIRQASYEVGADLRDAVLAQDAWTDRFFAPGRRDARWQFDLAGYCAARLAAAGIARVGVLDADTAADADTFFSYRRRTLGGGGPIGHQISIIALDPR
jgi:YfiH family protein